MGPENAVYATPHNMEKTRQRLAKKRAQAGQG